MCDMTAFMVKDMKEEQIMGSVTKLVVENNVVSMTSIFGDRKKVSGSIIEVDFDRGKVLIATT